MGKNKPPRKRAKTIQDRDEKMLASFSSIAKSLKTLCEINIRTEKRLNILISGFIASNGQISQEASIKLVAEIQSVK